MTFHFLLIFLICDLTESFSVHLSSAIRRENVFEVNSASNSDFLNSLIALRSSKFVNAKNAILLPSKFLCTGFCNYIPRDDEATNVVKLMEKRRRARSQAQTPQDKSYNSLIAVPGCPGIGKSAFLTNFPFSKAYKEYLQGKSPIVSAFTFNGVMEGPAYLGLRIVFGACTAMGLISYDGDAWNNFQQRFKDAICDDMNEAKFAIKILRELFGDNRPILILIDEISKAKDILENSLSSSVCTKVGALLDLYGDVDVVMSSLEPQYMNDLVTESQRDVDFVVLSTMIYSDLGKNECLEWANGLIAVVGPENLPQVTQNLLRNAYRLYSGHPRSLQKMAEDFKSVVRKPVWSQFAKTQLKKSTGEILRALDTNLSFYKKCGLGTMTNRDLEDHVFRTPSLSSITSPSFRLLVNIGALFVLKQGDVDDVFYTSVQAIALLRMRHFYKLSLAVCSSDFLSAVYTILEDIYSFHKLSDLWERIVALTIIGRSYSLKSSISDLLGVVMDPSEDITDRWNIGVIEAEQRHSEGNTLFIPVEGTAGYDSLVRLFDHRDKSYLEFYLQMKVAPPPAKSLSDLVGAVIANCLDDYCARTVSYSPHPPLSTLHVVVYVWGAEDSYLHSLSSIDVKAAALITLTTSKLLLMERSDGFSAALVSQFVDECWSHLHVVGQTVLKDWLNPSLVPLALLIQATEDGITVD